MNILAISDIHGRFDAFTVAQLPDADLCVIAGDITNRGLRDTGEFMRSEDWLRQLVLRFPVMWIPGNHDLEMPPDVYYPIGCTGKEHPLNSIYDRRDEFRGISFYGVSMSPAYKMPHLAQQWAHMTARWEVEQAAYEMPKVDVVVSHAPPHGVLDYAGYVLREGDQHIGSGALMQYICTDAPKLVICGHVHLNGLRGKARTTLLDNGALGNTLVVNVAETCALIDTETWEVVG